MLNAVNGLAEIEDALGIRTAICRHAISLRPSTNIQGTEAIKAILQKLDVLAEFAAADELCESIRVENMGDGEDLEVSEVSLYSTERAAKAFRQSLSDFTII